AIAPELKNIGMVTDAKWFDADGDKDFDLAVCGEYMPIQIFINDGGTLTKSPNHQITKSSGWWNCLEVSDLDGDGDLDLVAGNHGFNSRFKASPEEPVTMLVNDFDHNGTAEHIVSAFAPANFGSSGGVDSPSGVGGDAGERRSFPLALRHDLVKQLPFLKKKYLYYKDYKNQPVETIFTPEQLTGSVRLAAEQLQSCVFLNDGKGNFEMRPLPIEAQFAPVYAVLAEDFNGDGKKDLLLGGNFYRSKPEVGIYDGSYGWLLLGDGKGNFQTQLPRQSGFFVKGEIRDMISLPVKNKRLILVARNNEAMEVFQIR
ncbi:MAG: VCBS repeat-containing protein, partial [Bacteroidota bacterium]